MFEPLRQAPAKSLRLLLLVFAALLLGGCCAEHRDVPCDKISQDEHASGDNQLGLYREVLPKPLKVVVEGPRVPGLLGGKGYREPVCGAEVLFTVDDPESGAVFVESGQPVATVETKAGGRACVSLRLGDRPGDVNVTASVRTGNDQGGSAVRKTVHFRAIAGAEKIGLHLEATTNATINPVGVRLFESSGTPAEGVTVYFRVEGNGQDALVGGDRIARMATGADGRAVTSWTLGDDVAQYFLSVEIEDKRPGIPSAQRFQARSFEIEAMGMNKAKMALELMGGLAIFILGMKWMSGGLKRMADRRLKTILQALTKNRFLAVTVGAALTAVIQSSSATTVMTVGFVNAGLMTLTQAIGVIYGANIGTTVTAQIIAFRLDALAYPSIGLGLLMAALAKRQTIKSLGEAILGFGLLFLGMATMSSILKPLRYSPEFQSVFQWFDCTPVNGRVPPGAALMCILVGTAATCMIQSSSATVGLVIALSAQGLISFYTAVPLVLGDNIGTTITAVLASMGANRNAKRAALAHTLFNVFGAGYMYLLLFVPVWNGEPFFLGFVNAITPGDIFGEAAENLPRHVANAHTAFNLFNCLLFVPFIGLMSSVVRKVIPMTIADQEQVLQYLEPHLLETPTLALQQAVKEVGYMVRRSQKSINEGVRLFVENDKDLASRIIAREEVIDRLQAEITGYLVELSRKPMSAHESSLIPALVHAVNDAERIGDHSENLIELTHLMHEGNFSLSEDALADIRSLLEILNEQFDATCKALEQDDAVQVERVLAKEEEITAFMQRASEGHVARLETGSCNVQMGVIFLDFLAHLERVGDHLANIAERAGSFIRATAA